jgi:dephospho-CoA kinase
MVFELSIRETVETMLQVGLTGGIASGKSTVARMFEEKGAFLIDFDELAHFVEEPDRPGWEAVVEYFGSDILHDDRTINREKLGAIVFYDKEKLASLNRLVHPVIFEEWKRRVAEIQKINSQAVVISDIPLLIEVGLKPLLDTVILVYASSEDQIRRLMLRNRCSREEANARLTSQMPIDDKISHADFVIDNRGSIEKTAAVVQTVWEELLIREQKKTESPGVFIYDEDDPKI